MLRRGGSIDIAKNKRWNGSSWQDCQFVRRWNGAAWVDVWVPYTADSIVGVEFLFILDTSDGGTLAVGSNYAQINAVAGNTESSWEMFVVVITSDGKRWRTTKVATNTYYDYDTNAYETDLFKGVDITCNLSFNNTGSGTWAANRWMSFMSKDMYLAEGQNYITGTEKLSPPQIGSYTLPYHHDGHFGLSCTQGTTALVFSVSSVTVAGRTIPTTFVKK